MSSFKINIVQLFQATFVPLVYGSVDGCRQTVVELVKHWAGFSKVVG